jgi:hypothetical protein
LRCSGAEVALALLGCGRRAGGAGRLVAPAPLGEELARAGRLAAVLSGRFGGVLIAALMCRRSGHCRAATLMCVVAARTVQGG